MYRLIVHGEPASQGSKARGRYGGVYEQMGPKVRAWRDAIKAAAVGANLANARLGQSDDDKPVPLYVGIVFHVKRPKAHYRTGRFSRLLRDDAPTYVAQDPDVDKLVRATFDGLQVAGVIYDDNRIVCVRAMMLWANGRAGAAIEIHTWPQRAIIDYPPI